MKKFIKKLPGGIKFVLSMILIYGVLFLVSPSFISKSFFDFLEGFSKLLPMLIFFFFIIFIINFFLRPETVKRHLGQSSGLKGWVYACLGSVFVSSPPYVVFPMLKELREHGMKYSLIAVFMNNRNVQPAFLPVMAYYFGWAFTVVMSVYIMIFAILNAVIAGKIMDKAKS